MSDIITIEIKDECPVTTETGYGVIRAGGTSDHSRLTGRELPDQHPISAISDLEQELHNRLTSEDLTEYSDSEVNALWELIMRG